MEAIQWTGQNITAVQDWLTAHARPFYKMPSQPNGFHTPQELHVRLVGNTICVDIGTSSGYRCAKTGNWFLMSWAGLSVLTDLLFKRNYAPEPPPERGRLWALEEDIRAGYDH